MSTFVEVGMGVNRKRGYGLGFPFKEGDTYLGIDYRCALGSVAYDLYGQRTDRPVVLNMETLDRAAMSNLTVNRMVRPNARDLIDYANMRNIQLVAMYAEWHKLPLQDDSVDGLLLGNIMGDPLISEQYKTKLLSEACRVVKPGRLVVAKETIAPFTAHEYFANHTQWEATGVCEDSERWPEMGKLYDAHYRGVVFEVEVPASRPIVQQPETLAAHDGPIS